MSKRIPLTQGQYAIVDDEDYERVMAQGSWCASHNKRRNIYVAISSVNGRLTQMHRFIMSATPGQELDHVNMNTLDNRRVNLRFCNRAENNMNKRKQSGTYSSRYKGVSRSKDRNRWEAYVCHNNGKEHIGQFDSEHEAAEAYNIRAQELFGEFVMVNKIEG